MRDTPSDVPPHDRSTLVTWIDAQRAIFGRWLEAELVEAELTKSAGGTGLAGSCRGSSTFSEALSASARATLRAEEDLMRRWAERVAADPRSSKLGVEAAHQMYELALSCTSTKAALYDSWFAAFRTFESAPFTGAWRSVFRVWRGALVPRLTERRSVQPARSDFDGGPGSTTRAEEPAAPENGPH
jgi:hypothetical protein